MNKTFQEYKNLIQKWNKNINLVGDDSDESIYFHIDDCLALIPYIENGARVLDLGSGAGFPGIPVFIERPDIELVMVDAKRKRVSFINEVIRKLELKNAKAIWGRIEDQANLGQFDVIVSKAVWKLSDYVEKAHLFMKPTGKIIAMKSNQLELEEKNVEKVINTLGISLWKKVAYELMGKKRTLFIYNKNDNCMSK